MIFETHAHYDEKEFDPDREELLSALKEKNVGRVINVGTNEETSKISLEYAKKYDFVYAAVGVHPEFAEGYTDRELEVIRELSGEKKVISIGEIGLDYHYDDSPEIKRIQAELFDKQLKMALELGLPVIIHSRDAAADTMEFMKTYAKKGLRGVMHCYSYSLDQALQYVKMGYYIGIGGAVTFKNAAKKVEIVRKLPMESILLETDCPFMAPEPVRGTRNYSGNLNFVAEKIADIKGVSVDEVINTTEKNAEELFLV